MRPSNIEIIDGISSIDEAIVFARSIGTILNQQDDDGSGVTTISPAININKKAYSSDSLFVHTDRSTMDNPPDYILLWYEQISEYGGQPTIFDAANLIKTEKINDYNFEAIFASENDNLMKRFSFYDPTAKTFRFRKDQYIYINTDSLPKYHHLIEHISQNIITLNIKPKQCILLNNKQVLHGRTSFKGKRKIHRIQIYKDTHASV